MTFLQHSQSAEINQGDSTPVQETSRGHIVTDGDTNRILVGYDPDGFGTGIDYGIKVSQEGYDVLTAADNNLVMSSAFNLFKIVATGTASVTGDDRSGSGLWAATSATNTFTLAHGLGYVPTYLVYGDQTGSLRNYYPGGYAFNASMANYPFEAEVQVYADATNFKIFFSTRGGSNFSATTLSLRYYLMRETATT